MNKKGFFKSSLKLMYWVFFQAPDKFDEMVDYCVKQIENDGD